MAMAGLRNGPRLGEHTKHGNLCWICGTDNPELRACVHVSIGQTTCVLYLRVPLCIHDCSGISSFWMSITENPKTPQLGAEASASLVRRIVSNGSQRGGETTTSQRMHQKVNTFFWTVWTKSVSVLVVVNSGNRNPFRNFQHLHGPVFHKRQ